MRGEGIVPAESGLRGPLVGLRVMDIATVYAAPFAAALLADYGADVLKVEMPEVGDPLRELEPFDGEESLVWAALSRNKRSVTLDLRKERGQEIFLRLLAEQDVLIENFRPGTLKRWGLGIERLREANPDVVVVRVSGYGQTGPYREKAGFGTPATGFSGFAYITGYPDRPPVLPQVSLADYVTGLFAALGAMTALYHRDALGGEAQEVDAALYESMFRMLETVVTQYDRLGVVRERTGNELGASVPAGIFSSKDGKWMVLTTSTDRTFRRLASSWGARIWSTIPATRPTELGSGGAERCTASSTTGSPACPPRRYSGCAMRTACQSRWRTTPPIYSGTPSTPRATCSSRWSTLPSAA